jgi:hypothetical protein
VEQRNPDHLIEKSSECFGWIISHPIGKQLRFRGHPLKGISPFGENTNRRTPAVLITATMPETLGIYVVFASTDSIWKGCQSPYCCRCQREGNKIVSDSPWSQLVKYLSIQGITVAFLLFPDLNRLYTSPVLSTNFHYTSLLGSQVRACPWSMSPKIYLLHNNSSPRAWFVDTHCSSWPQFLLGQAISGAWLSSLQAPEQLW